MMRYQTRFRDQGSNTEPLTEMHMYCVAVCVKNIYNFSEFSHQRTRLNGLQQMLMAKSIQHE